MIFVTVGTHEQQFNRLVKYMDEVKKRGVIQDEIIIQIGFSTYLPQYCQWSKFISYEKVLKIVSDARIIVTHGGPSSFVTPLQIGKVPIVVPRQKHFGEHVNDHQIEFCKKVAERQKNIILVENVKDLESMILRYEEITKTMESFLKSNNRMFNEELEKIVNNIVS